MPSLKIKISSEPSLGYQKAKLEAVFDVAYNSNQELKAKIATRQMFINNLAIAAAKDLLAKSRRVE